MKGRPLAPIDNPKAPRLRFWRTRRGKSQGELAEFLGLSQPQIARIERGENALDLATAERLAALLDVGATDLLPGGPPTVPLVYRVGLALEGAPVIEGRAERIPAPPRLERPEECFAAEIVDDSANRLGWPAGSFAFARETAALAGGLARGDRVLVAVYETTRAERKVAHVLAGELTPTALGDLLVLMRSSRREVPPAIVIRASSAAPGMALADRQAVALHSERVDYAPRDADAAEILGRVERAIVP